ncbi:MAG TPA: FeS-binding protein [Treponema sp.]|nr:FeS-binding protein [Treponema sp.]
MTTTVALQKCDEYDFDKVYAAVQQLFRLVPPPDVRGKTVLVKPNILSPKKPENAVCTHPVVVGAVVKSFVELGAARVLAGESPGVGSSISAAKATGVYDEVVKNGGEWADFGADQVTVMCPHGRLVKSFEFAAQFERADVVVSLAKLKTHQLMSYTGAMKNLFGLMVGLKKAQTHYRFPDKKEFGMFLVDLNIAADASYAVMDAVVGMEGSGGPGNGDPVKLGFLAASDNIAALDWECASIVGYNPHDIVYLEEALQRGVWFASPDRIRTAGCTAEDVKPASFKIVKTAAPALEAMLPSWVNAAAKALFTRSPSFNKAKCVRCERCVEICPVHILSFAEDRKTGKRVTIGSRSSCLHCFCCHEICPAEAVSLRHFVRSHY